MKKSKLFLGAMIVAVASSSVFAHGPAAKTDKIKAKEKKKVVAVHYPAAPTNKFKAKEKKQLLALPDLRVRQFIFANRNDKAIKVVVANLGATASGPCRLFLTVRKIDGVSVGRRTHVNLPAIGAGKIVSVIIDATSILPKSVSLESTTFRLDVDATGIVAESDEINNTIWHNL